MAVPCGRPFSFVSLFLLNSIGLRAVKLGSVNERMAGLGAKMWHVDHRGGVIGPKRDLLTRSKFAHPLAQAQHGQGAQKPAGIYDISAHKPHLGTMFQPVHNLVT